MKRIVLALGMAAMLAAGTGTALAGGTPSQKCSASLRKCIGKVFASIMACHAKAAVTVGDVTDAACVAAANGKFDACASKALSHGGCNVDQAGVDHIKNEDIAPWTDDMKGDTVP